MRIPFVQVDAFARAPFTGNPAAVMPLTHWPADPVLLAIARENNLSETAFLLPIADSEDDGGTGADFALRWFTPGGEVELCGHATMASGHYVLASDPARDRVAFRTRHAGVLHVSRGARGYELSLPAWTPRPEPLPAIVAALRLADPVDTLWQDRGYALIVVADEATVRACDPDMRALAAQGRYVVIVAAPGEETDFVSRVFVPAFDIDEDPVTGSAHAVMTPYWAERLGRDTLTAYQASARGGWLTCRIEGDRVVLGGECVTVIEGVFLLDR